MAKLILGSAQFGYKYGITNKFSAVQDTEILKIGNNALESGITTVDTAISYGDAEIKLGKLFGDRFQYISKIKLPDCADELDNWIDWTKEQISLSLENLKTDKLHGVLFHNSRDLLSSRGEKVYQSLLNQKKEGLISKIGVSIYEPNDFFECCSGRNIDIVQGPYNIFDQRASSSGLLKQLKNDGIEFHARSPFLQGLLLEDSKKLPDNFNRWKSDFDYWANFTAKSHTTKLEACISFLAANKDVTKIVAGVQNNVEFKELITAFQGKISFPDCNLEKFSKFDTNLIDPRRW